MLDRHDSEVTVNNQGINSACHVHEAVRPAALIQLASGDWVDPLTVVRIATCGDEGPDGFFGHRVTVRCSDGKKMTIAFPDWEAAEAYRDQLAQQVNEARK